jgi:hypothetical protein
LQAKERINEFDNSINGCIRRVEKNKRNQEKQSLNELVGHYQAIQHMCYESPRRRMEKKGR